MALYLHIPYVFHYMKLRQLSLLELFSNSLHFYSDYEFEGSRTVNYTALHTCDMVTTMT